MIKYKHGTVLKKATVRPPKKQSLYTTDNRSSLYDRHVQYLLMALHIFVHRLGVAYSQQHWPMKVYSNPLLNL